VFLITIIIFVVADLDACLSSPCSNGGTCIPEGQASFSCQCMYGVTGQRCQTIKKSQPELPECIPTRSYLLNDGPKKPTQNVTLLLLVPLLCNDFLLHDGDHVNLQQQIDAKDVLDSSTFYDAVYAMSLNLDVFRMITYIVSYKEPGQYTATVTISNDQEVPNHYSVSTVVDIEPPDTLVDPPGTCTLPNVTVLGAARDIANRLTFIRSNQITLQAKLSHVPCHWHRAEFHWNVYESTSNGSDLYPITLKSVNLPQIVLPKYSLSYGVFSTQVTVSFIGLLNRRLQWE